MFGQGFAASNHWFHCVPEYPQLDGRELAINLFFDGYSEDEASIWGQIGYLLLDEALGEHDVEAKVGPIRFFPFDAHPDAARYPLPDLPAMFDAHFATLKREH